MCSGILNFCRQEIDCYFHSNVLFVLSSDDLKSCPAHGSTFAYRDNLLESANKPVPNVATILCTTEVDMHEDATQGKVAPPNKGSDMWENRLHK